MLTFNRQKEQADGDYQNLVCILQHAHDLDLQEAIDLLTKMIAGRVNDYVELKKSLPSFGPHVDTAVHRYLTALEQFTQGCVVWYYSSPRYFRHQNPLGSPEILIHLFPKTTPEPEAAVRVSSQGDLFLVAKQLLGIIFNYISVLASSYLGFMDSLSAYQK